MKNYERDAEIIMFVCLNYNETGNKLEMTRFINN